MFFFFQKLAGLWLVGEMVNHVGLYGSKVAEGCSAFQRRSCETSGLNSTVGWKRMLNRRAYLLTSYMGCPPWALTTCLVSFLRSIPLQISLISVKISRADECLSHSLNGRLERWSFDIDSRFQFIDFLSFVAMTLHAIRIEGSACFATSDKQVQFSSTFGDLDDDLYSAVPQLE